MRAKNRSAVVDR